MQLQNRSKKSNTSLQEQSMVEEQTHVCVATFLGWINTSSQFKQHWSTLKHVRFVVVTLIQCVTYVECLYISFQQKVSMQGRCVFSTIMMMPFSDLQGKTASYLIPRSPNGHICQCLKKRKCKKVEGFGLKLISFINCELHSFPW